MGEAEINDLITRQGELVRNLKSANSPNEVRTKKCH